MSWQTRAEGRHTAWRLPGSRRAAAALLVGLALVVALAMAACGATSISGGAQPTATPKPTATVAPTPTPQPCTGWRIVASPNGTKYQWNQLFAVSARSPSAVWAVGANLAGGPGPVASLTERWDGAAWHIVAHPGADFLYGVAAISPADVWAVGGHQNFDTWTSVIYHWDGTQWRPVPSQNPAGLPYNTLTSVAAVAASDVWAVGRIQAADTQPPLIEHWDGTAWRVVAPPKLPGSLISIARIPGTNQLWAVGYAPQSIHSDYEQALIERWDGAAWRVVASPTLPSGALGGRLSGVIALSPTDAWAVGEYSAGQQSDHQTRPLTAHWDGATWKVVPSPDIYAELESVAATGQRDVRAVGHTFVDDPADGTYLHALIEQWDGTAWRVETGTEPSGGRSSNLNSITTDGAGNYWAVGTFLTGSIFRTLTLHCP